MIFSPPAEFCNFYDSAGSVLDSQHYIHPCDFTQTLKIYDYKYIANLSMFDKKYWTLKKMLWIQMQLLKGFSPIFMASVYEYKKEEHHI